MLQILSWCPVSMWGLSPVHLIWIFLNDRYTLFTNMSELIISERARDIRALTQHISQGQLNWNAIWPLSNKHIIPYSRTRYRKILLLLENVVQSFRSYKGLGSLVIDECACETKIVILLSFYYIAQRRQRLMIVEPALRYRVG